MSEHINEFTDQNFDNDVQKSDLPVSLILGSLCTIIIAIAPVFKKLLLNIWRNKGWKGRC